MRPIKHKYVMSDLNITVYTFEKFIKLTRKYPNSRISLVVEGRIAGSCVYFEGMYYLNRMFTNKQKKFIKSNFKVEMIPERSKYLGKFQRRQVRIKFIKQWNGWEEDRRSLYIQRKARQYQRQSSAFPGCPTIQECLVEVIQDLLSMGCKDVYI